MAPPIQLLEDRRYLAAPVLDPVMTPIVPSGQTVQLPITASDADGDVLRYSVAGTTSGISASFHQSSNRWLELSTTQGVMQFQLFDDVAPRTVSNMVGLVNSGFFDGLQFYRIAKSGDQPVLIQTGSPNNDGTGGPGFQFDDEFDKDTIFSQPGSLAMLNGGKDTNGSQFFITAIPARTFDFNNTIWGQLVRGFDVLENFFKVPLTENKFGGFEQSVPTVPQAIKRATIIENRTDAVLVVKATDAGKVTVKVEDGNGGTDTQTIHIAADADPVDDPPILGPASDMVGPKNRSMSFRISYTDPESDPGEYRVDLQDTLQGSARIDGDIVTFTPRKNLTGPVILTLGVRTPGATARGYLTTNPFDTQKIQIGVGDSAASGYASRVQAQAGFNSGNTIVATFRDTDPRGTPDNWRVIGIKDTLGNYSGGINWGDGTFSDGEIIGLRDGSFAVVSRHSYANPGVYPITVTIDGDLGARLTLVGSADVRPLTDVADGILTVNGTSGRDIIHISNDGTYYNVSMNGNLRRVPADNIHRVHVFALDGPDDVSIGKGVPRAYVDGGTGNDLINGGDGDDTLTAGAGKNTLNGHGGNDRINGSGGRDYLTGGEHDDRIYGNGGNDTLDGGGGVDRLWGGAGDDLLIGGGSNDKLFGESGNDTLFGRQGADYCDGGLGIDRVQQDGVDILIATEIEF